MSSCLFALSKLFSYVTASSYFARWLRLYLLKVLLCLMCSRHRNGIVSLFNDSFVPSPQRCNHMSFAEFCCTTYFVLLVMLLKFNIFRSKHVRSSTHIRPPIRYSNQKDRACTICADWTQVSTMVQHMSRRI